MSVVNVARHAAGLMVLADSAGTDPDGVVQAITSKLLIFPHMPAVIGARGPLDLVPALFAMYYPDRSFDGLLAAIRDTPTSHLARATGREPPTAFELVVAGYSRARDAFEVYLLCGHNECASLGLPPFGLKRIKGNCFLPAPNPAVAKDMGWQMPALGDGFDLARDGLKLIECQRRDPVNECRVGGFVQAVKITRHGVASWVAKWWPDEVGRKIEPMGAALIAG